MKSLSRVVLLAATVSSLSSCALIEKYSYKPNEITSLEKGPKFDVKNFFNGDLEVFAINQDNDGKITGTFTAKMNGKWDENKGVLQQSFTYDNGKKDSRTWLITADSDGTFNAVGHDVVTPVKGKQIGNAMQMLYSLSVKVDGVKQNSDREDNFYLVDDRSAIGIAFIRKDGSAAGKSIISYKKVSKADKSEKVEKVEKSENSTKSE